MIHSRKIAILKFEPQDDLNLSIKSTNSMLSPSFWRSQYNHYTGLHLSSEEPLNSRRKSQGTAKIDTHYDLIDELLDHIET